ncbi:MAG: ABC transporter substrate-binding protein [Hydrogenibacillus schlegelii]|uniref:ABC transporter substrate-binding protein n=1 Tax=Hydrogenibacillus schlegelii TaxID=1484 RepID=A0A947CVC3_HYDSH|nr:ABC transporter substrate-binding protein [Hydrogenibacillus schlegelii]
MHDAKGVFNPWFYDTAYDKYVIDLIFEALGKYGKDGSIIPDLATWEIKNDGKTYVFHLDPNAKFADGTPVTAEDAAFSFYVYLDPSYDGRADMSVAKIVGADAYRNDKEGKVTTIEGIKVLDEHTLQIDVEEPNALTLEYLTVAVLPKHYYGKNFKKGDLSEIKKLLDKPLGSGPYKLVSYVPQQEVRLTANENFWRDQKPTVKNIVFKATTDETNLQLIQTGETDIEESISVNKDNIEAIDAAGFLDRSMLLNNGFGYIALNHEHKPLDDKRVRQALMYGLNREDIVYAYSQGLAHVIDVPQSKVSWAYPEDESQLIHYNYDPEKAAQLLDEAGWKMGSDGYRYKDGKKLTLHFAASTPNPVNDALVPIAKENYKALGIDFVVEQLEFNAVLDKMKKGDYDMAFLAVGLSPDPDPYELFHTNGGTNKQFYHYSNPEVDRLIEAGQKELDKVKRKAIYNDLYKLLNEEVPILYMYQRYNMRVINSRIKGFKGEITPYYDFTNQLPYVQLVQ